MSIDKKYIQESRPYRRESINNQANAKNVYWGKVISIDDPSEGGRIKIRVPELDTKTPDENLPYCYPLVPKFFHIYPQVGEVVRIILEDPAYPQRSRYWIGSVISQLQKVGFDGITTALNTTNVGVGRPEKALSQYPNARGVFPEKNEIALIGKDNTDVILRNSQVEIRAGKHEVGDVFELNRTNPASFSLTYEQPNGGTETRSTSLIISDKIALISHDGIPKFKASEIDEEERNRIIANAHPLARADVLLQILEVYRRAIFQHVHPYAKLPADKSSAIVDLERLDLTSMLQNNILIN